MMHLMPNHQIGIEGIMPNGAAGHQNILRIGVNEMTDTKSENVVPIKRSLADEVRGEVAMATAGATQADHKAVSELIKKATGAEYSVSVVTLTPGMSGLLFLNHNSHNRPWNPGWSQELARRMTAGQWKRNSMSIGFYIDGTVEDMQHRCAAAAISGTTWTVPCVFGIEKGAVDTIDGGRHRSGADHAGLDGIAEPSRKQQIVKAAAAYFVRVGDKAAALKSESEVKAAIESNDAVLTHAMEISELVRNDVKRSGDPVLKQSTADIIAYVLLRSGWPVQRIREKLARLQAGISTEGDNDPFFVAAQIIESRRKKSARGEKLTVTKEIGIAVFAMVETEKGIRSVQPRHVKAAVDGKTVPDPHYPAEVSEQAA